MENEAQRRRISPLLVVGAAVVLILLTLLLANAPRPPLVEGIEGPPVPVPMEPLEMETSPEPELFPEEVLEDERVPIEVPGWVPDLLEALVVAGVLALIAVFLRRLWQARIKVQRSTAGRPSGEGVEIVDLDEEELAQTVKEAVASLRHGMAVEGAVVECWRRLERLAADTGVRRRRSQTSQEFTVEILGHTGAEAAAVEELAELYRQAMFSTHTLTDADRERAIACLEALRAQLMDP